MAYPKKKTPAGSGPGDEPPADLAVPKPAAEGQGNGEYGECVRIEGPVAVQGPPPPQNPKDPPAPPIRVESVGPVKVSLQRSTVDQTDEQALWVAIRDRTNVIGFSWYERFIDRVLCEPITDDKKISRRRDEEAALRKQRQDLGERLYIGVDAYQLLKTATEAFLILKCGIVPNSAQLLPPEKRFLRIRSQEEARLGRTISDIEVLRKELSNYVSAGNFPYIERVLGNLSEPDLDEEEDEDEKSLQGGVPMALVSKGAVDSPFCDTLIDVGPHYPLMLELLWSYWHEEGMLVQAINAISLRFQNKRLPGENNPLSNLELSPLRPLSNLLWGYIQDEPFRLTVARRAYEYSHQYGLTLVGKAVPGMRPADHRSKFLEAFHSLLHEVALFYKQDADTTVIANGFPLLNSLKEVHMLLAEGAHNQFGDLPWTARVEMLIQQWLLSRRELRDFLRGRPMVPYKEPWMGQVDTLRRMFGWGDTPVTHFRDLGTFGEQILLSIRYGDWINVDVEDAAKNWARYWKPEIQGYVHAYRAVTGIDLTTDDINKQINTTSPSVLLQRRIGQRGAR